MKQLYSDKDLLKKKKITGEGLHRSAKHFIKDADDISAV